MTIRIFSDFYGLAPIDGSIISGAYTVTDCASDFISWLKGWDIRLDNALTHMSSRIWDDIYAVSVDGGTLADTIYVMDGDDVAYTVVYEISEETL